MTTDFLHKNKKRKAVCNQSGSFLSGPSLAKQELPFINGELMRWYLIIAAKEICPEKMNMFKSIRFS